MKTRPGGCLTVERVPRFWLNRVCERMERVIDQRQVRTGIVPLTAVLYA